MDGDVLLACAYQFVHHASAFFHHILKMLANLCNLKKKKSGFLERVTICEPSTAPPEVDASPSAGSAALVSSSGTTSAASSFSSSWHNTEINRGGGVRLSRGAAPCSDPGWLDYSKRSKQLNCCFSFKHILFKHLPL